MVSWNGIQNTRAVILKEFTWTGLRVIWEYWSIPTMLKASRLANSKQMTVLTVCKQKSPYFIQPIKGHHLSHTRIKQTVIIWKQQQKKMAISPKCIVRCLWTKHDVAQKNYWSLHKKKTDISLESHTYCFSHLYSRKFMKAIKQAQRIQ